MNYYFDVLKKYTVFDGRADRKEYWMFVLWSFIVALVLSIVLAVIANAIQSPMVSLLVWVYSLAVLLPSIGVGIRRLHDTDRSGWWVLIGLIPFIGAIVLVIFMVLEGTPGDNKYGPNPKLAAATN